SFHSRRNHLQVGRGGEGEPFTACFLLILDVRKGGLFTAFFLLKSQLIRNERDRATSSGFHAIESSIRCAERNRCEF
ncbi:MAG: hypothetical protein ACLFM2_10900, partial [Halothece sp.]